MNFTVSGRSNHQARGVDPRVLIGTLGLALVTLIQSAALYAHSTF